MANATGLLPKDITKFTLQLASGQDRRQPCRLQVCFIPCLTHTLQYVLLAGVLPGAIPRRAFLQRKLHAGLDDALPSNEIELGDEMLHHSADMLIDLDSNEEHMDPRVTRCVSSEQFQKDKLGQSCIFSQSSDFSSVTAQHWFLAWQ